jgi:hypothetical protein
MAKKAKTKKRVRVAWTKAHDKELRVHSRSKTPVTKVSKSMKRTVSALRQRAFNMGISLGERT